MADTLIVKILRNRSGGIPLQAGDIAVCDVDLAAIIDIQFSHDRFGDITSRLGHLADLAEAGATITNPTRGACFGYHMGLVAVGETCITASTRNFRGRMGSPGASIFMASPATVAASALRGAIADIRELEGIPA